MHIIAAFEQHFSRRSNGSSNAGATRQGVSGASIVDTGSSSARWWSCCLPCGGGCLPADVFGHKLHVWCLLGLLVGSSVVCIGLFEATRLSTHVLRSPCTITGSEMVDIGTCTLCDDSQPQVCEVHPIASARVSVTFRPKHSTENITGWVWYCKGRASVDPCEREMRFLDQLSLDIREYGREYTMPSPVPCTTGEVFAYMQMRAAEGSNERECYYSSRDTVGEDVWLSMPNPGLVGHAWFQKHLEYPVFLALGGLILLSVLLGCLALEGAELWASGLL